MKKTIFYFALLLSVNCIIAQSVIVLHSTDTTAVFTGNTAFNDAYTLAENGDTLYLSGGAFTISSDIEKGLKIFGAGVHPDSTSATYITQISGIVNIKNGADGLYFEGIEFSHNVQENFSQVVNNVSFVRCKFNQHLDFGSSGTPSTLRTSYSFIQCVFMSFLTLDGVTNSIITNSIFNQKISLSHSNTFNNCSFLYTATNSSTSNRLIYNSNTNIISNCIFHSSSAISLYYNYIIDGASNTIHNCIFEHTDPILGSTPIETNNYKGIDLSTVFIELPSNSFSFDDNYHLSTSAEASYLGNEGTQVGVYGGLFPLKEGFVPQNPHISAKTISSGTDENGLLNVEIEVNAQDN
ncbi:MAG: hypothetical protein PHW82_09785 [Bacteroidales bacterium]|nr:hypothetical protein [Bacteroidales bacterium]